MRESWPKQHRLIRQVRDVLLREFGCQDAWIVRAGGRCRLEVRFRGRQFLLLEDEELNFWARFYTPVEHERVHLGDRVVLIQQWRKRTPDLIALLGPYWVQQVGPLPGEPGQRRPE